MNYFYSMAYTVSIEEENKEIASRYKDLLKGTYQLLTTEDKKSIRKAFDLAVDAHSSQRRKTGEPYIYHPIAVAKIVAYEIGLGVTSIVAALLHDVVEDTDVGLELIYRDFWLIVWQAVGLLTKKKWQSYMDYIELIKGNAYATAVKIADICDNLMDAPTDKAIKKYCIALDYLTKPNA